MSSGVAIICVGVASSDFHDSNKINDLQNVAIFKVSQICEKRQEQKKSIFFYIFLLLYTFSCLLCDICDICDILKYSCFVKYNMRETPKSIHEKYYDSEHDHLSIVSLYHPLQKVWKLYGYNCRHCDRTIKNRGMALRHITCCKIMNSVNFQDRLRSLYGFYALESNDIIQ